jgi:hypothetical protein
MTFTELYKILSDTGRLPPGGRPAASFIVPSAEGLPSRDLGIDVRAPKRITAEQAAWLRSERAA